MAFSVTGILFASIPTGHPGEVIIHLNLFRIPLMFVSGLFIPLDAIPQAGLILAFLSPPTYTLDLVRTGVSKGFFFGIRQRQRSICLDSRLLMGRSDVPQDNHEKGVTHLQQDIK